LTLLLKEQPLQNSRRILAGLKCLMLNCNQPKSREHLRKSKRHGKEKIGTILALINEQFLDGEALRLQC
jgi:hypothetical protein